MEDQKQQNNQPPDAPPADGAVVAPSRKKPKSRLIWVLPLLFLAMVIRVSLSPRLRPLEWVTDYAAGIEMAKQQNKPVMLAFYKADMRMCSDMWNDTYKNQSAIDFVEQNFIPILIDIDKQPELAQQYEISYYPTHLVKPPGRNEIIGTRLGHDPPILFIQKLTEYLERIDSLEQ